MTRRIGVVGTDTGVGKTAVTCALLRALRTAGTTAWPFKPAASSPPGEPTDAHRLLAAADRTPDDLPIICPLHYERRLAPGIAHDPAPFLDDLPPNSDPLHHAAQVLHALENQYAPDVVLLEGAGGLHVPMPGGTWQPHWFETLAPDVLIVGRVGLGTVNHTTLTVEACRHSNLRPFGFVFVDTGATHDPSAVNNAAIVARATGCPHLATAPFAPHDPDRHTGWVTSRLLAALV